MTAPAKIPAVAATAKKKATETELTATEFRAILDKQGIRYSADGDRTEITKANGSVYLGSLTALPEGTTFSNRGSVYLGSLTALPEGTTFSNRGSVYLGSLTAEEWTYQGRAIRLRNVDGFTMLIGRERKRGGITIASARYFGGGDIDKLCKCFIASEDGHNAHGETVEAALRDLRFKIAAEDFDPDDTLAEIRRTGMVERHQFRLLTGACDEGLFVGMEQAGLKGDAEKLPLDTVLGAIHGDYGARFRQLVEAGK